MITNNTIIEKTVKPGYIFISDIHGNKKTIDLIGSDGQLFAVQQTYTWNNQLQE